MWNGKKKALTFSFDDGVTQDIRLLEILNKYGLKGTFNLNSGLLGLPREVERNGKMVNHTKVQPSQVRSLYEGHEVAVHTLSHPTLTPLSENAIVYQVDEDRKLLEDLVGYSIVGMAYPNGPNDDRVAEIIEKNTPIRYSRTVTSTFDFTPQREKLLRYNPTVYYVQPELDGLVERFLSEDGDDDKLLYIWGHSY